MSKGLILAIITALLTGLSFALRLNYWTLYEYFGFYQGDIWYFFTFYQNQIQSEFFYPLTYPVGYIIILKICYLLSTILGQYNYQNFLIAHALILVPLTALTTWLLYKISLLANFKPSLFFYYVLSPSLFVYSTINYDIFPISLSLIAIYFLLKRQLHLSSFFLALATVIKFYPIIFLPMIVLYCLNQKISIKKIAGYLIIFITTLSAINLPFILTDFQTWTYPYQFQSTNPEMNDPTTLSYYLIFFNLEYLRKPLWIIFILTSWFISFKFYKSHLLTPTNLIYLLLLSSFSMVIGNHVYTPQYMLWFLPFLAIISRPILLLWWPLDWLNASTRFFYFKFKTVWQFEFDLIHSFTIIVFCFLYSYLMFIIIQRKKYGQK